MGYFTVSVSNRESREAQNDALGCREVATK